MGLAFRPVKVRFLKVVLQCWLSLLQAMCVDLFPHTEGVEVVVLFERLSTTVNTATETHASLPTAATPEIPSGQ